MVGPIDSLLRVRLDTLPAAELRHLAAPWCDATPPAAADTLASLAGGGVPAADAVSAAVAVEERVGAYTKEGLRVMVERWHRAREIYRDVDAATLFGPENSLSYGAQRDTLAAAADSLAAHDLQSAGAPVADTLGAAADSLASSADTLSVASDTLSVAADSLHAAAADTIAAADAAARGADTLSGGMLSGVGDAVREAVGGMSAAGDTAMAAALGYVVQNLLVAAVVFLYIFCLYRYFDDVEALFKSVFHRSVTLSERMLERRRSDIFYGFLGKLFLIGTCAVGAIVSLWAGGMPAVTEVSPYAHAVLPFAAMAAFVAVVAVQYAMLAVAGGVTRSWPTVATLLRIRLVYFVLSTVMVMPAVLMWQVDGGVAGNVWLHVAGVAGALAMALYVRESVTLFISKKISILHWFLYLCTVEIMPFTLLWQIIARMGK